MTLKITRRSLAAMALAVPAAAQAPPPPPAPIPSGPEEELNAIRAQYRALSAQLANTKFPMTTEPAIHFKP